MSILRNTTTSLATCSLTKWQLNATVFLLNYLPGLFALGDVLLRFMPIDRRWYLNMTDYSTALFNAVNLAPQVYVCTYVCLFYDQVVWFEPITKISPVINLQINLSRTWYASTKFSGIMNQIEVLGICHQYLLRNMSTDFQNIYSASLYYIPYLWSGVENLWHILALYMSSDIQKSSLLTTGVLP